MSSYGSGNGKFVFFAWLLSFLFTLGIIGAYGVNYILFNRDCSGYLKRAADASTVETASVELNKAISYLEDHNLTNGYTSVIYTTPDEDISFWYTNLKEADMVLKSSMTTDENSVSRSNALIKLRETLLHGSEKGSSITMPDGIWIYPNNGAYMFFFWFFFITLIGITGYGLIKYS